MRADFEKPIYREEFAKKKGLWQFADLRGAGLGKKEEGGVFEGWGVDTPMHTMQSTYEKIIPKDQCNGRNKNGCPLAH